MEKILVLNQNSHPIQITTLKKAFKLVYKGKAEIVRYDKKFPIVTETQVFKRPTIIKLIEYVTIPFRKVKLSRQNIFKRDNHQCLYCDSRKNLTIDHVKPKSRGGGDTWKNLATCCLECNLKKGNRTPEECGMVLRHNPYSPTFLQYVYNIYSDKNDTGWMTYFKK
jgi:hypothetical protein